jgi:hypothetical protein
VNKLLTCCNIRVAHSSGHTICDNAGRITESAKLGMKVFVLRDYHSPITMKSTKKLRTRVSYIFTAFEINILHRNSCLLHRNVHIPYLQHICAPQVPMYTSGSHTIQRMRLPIPKPPGNTFFRMEILCYFFLKRKPGIKQDLPVY